MRKDAAGDRKEKQYALCYLAFRAGEEDFFEGFRVDVAESNAFRMIPNVLAVVVGALNHEFTVVLLLTPAELLDEIRRLNHGIFYFKNQIVRWHVQLVRQVRLHDHNAAILYSSLLTHC